MATKEEIEKEAKRKKEDDDWEAQPEAVKQKRYEEMRLVREAAKEAARVAQNAPSKSAPVVIVESSTNNTPTLDEDKIKKFKEGFNNPTGSGREGNSFMDYVKKVAGWVTDEKTKKEEPKKPKEPKSTSGIPWYQYGGMGQTDKK